ncbi:MAG: VTC domain-containing protein [Verrucomicrobiales bacterium]|nr:VTC domain-containing protein [Verrucomicrobiales bacterium]
MTLYWHTINGNKNRYKLRLRFYDNRPESPVYFEIKRRVNDAILKQRASVRRDAVLWILTGHFPDPGQMLSRDPKHLVAVQHFVQLMNENAAKPKAHIAYLREAWVSSYSNAVRVTMDREVRCDPEPTARLEKNMRDPVLVFGDRVVLELKFTGRFPDWFREMVQVLGVAQASAAKYVDGVALAGEHRFADPSTSAPPRAVCQR